MCKWLFQMMENVTLVTFSTTNVSYIKVTWIVKFFTKREFFMLAILISQTFLIFETELLLKSYCRQSYLNFDNFLLFRQKVIY